MAAADKEESLGPANVAGQPGERASIAQPSTSSPSASSPSPHEQGATPHLDSPSGDVEPVSRTELNSWRRGITPQAEIWNGRLAMLGLSVGLSVLLIARLAAR